MNPQKFFTDADKSKRIEATMKLIINSEIITKDIIGLCPEISELSIENTIQLSLLIKAYILNNDQIIDIIGKITQCEDVIEYIEGIGIIVAEQGIQEIHEIDDYLSSIKNQIMNNNSEIEDIISYS